MTLKSFLLILLTSLGISPVFSQETESTNNPSPYRFFNSIDDYLEDNFIEGYRIIERPLGGYNSLRLKYVDESSDNRIEKRVTELPGKLFTYGTTLYRVVGKTVYLVLAHGKLNYYANYIYNDQQCYSLSWDGDLKKFKYGWFKRRLSEYNLLESYNQERPKKESGETTNDLFNHLVARNIKYFNLLNAKMN